MPSFGNHDMERGHGPQGYAGHQARFSLPGSELFGVYAFRWLNVAVVAIDANDVTTEITANRGYSKGAQVRWLDRTLGQLRADPTIDWIVAHYHHCSYCTILVHGSDGGCRSAFDELFARHQVDLVINGHNHGYERTHPLKRGEMTASVPTGGVVQSARDGTVFVCAGGGGQVSYPAFGGPIASYVTDASGLKIPELALWSAARLSGYSFISVDVDPSRLERADDDGDAGARLDRRAHRPDHVRTGSHHRLRRAAPATPSTGDGCRVHWRQRRVVARCRQPATAASLDRAARRLSLSSGPPPRSRASSGIRGPIRE